MSKKKEKAAHGDDIFGVFQNIYETLPDVQGGGAASMTTNAEPLISRKA